MDEKRAVKSPLGLRLLILAGCALLTVLLMWLLGFVLDDIGDFRRLDYMEFEKRFVAPDLQAQHDALEREIEEITRDIQAAGERRDFRRDAVDRSRQTMQQMIDLQRASLEKNQTVSTEQQETVTRAQKAFLDDQAEYQRESEEILALSSRKRGRETARQELMRRIEAGRETAHKEFRKEQDKRDRHAALLKILVLLPAVVLAAWLFASRRTGPMAPITWAVALAVLWHLVAVIHEHFPTRYHKYILSALAIGVVLRVLVQLIRVASAPGVRYRLRRYREAYARHECPVCGFPILRPDGRRLPAGGLRAGRHTVVVAMSPDTTEAEPYTCPSCGENLYRTCPVCRHVRHTLLPRCQYCGAPGDTDSPVGTAASGPASAEIR